MPVFIFVGIAIAVVVYLAFSLIPLFKEIPEHAFWESSESQNGILGAKIGGFLTKLKNVLKSGESIPDSDPSPIPSYSPSSNSSPNSDPGPDPGPDPDPSPPPTEPVVSINTYITSGPEEGEIIEETNRITFEFRARVSPEETEGNIIFETKIEGFDENWETISYNQRIVDFPPGPKEYTFLVKAKINDIVDSTPTQRTFKINTSPYFEKIQISNVQSQNSYDHSLIRLDVYHVNEEINITGWRVEGQKGGFSIPQGIEKYNHLFYSQLPGNDLPLKDIFVDYGHTIYLSSALNPLGRYKNFRLNKCIGYLAHDYDFAIDFYNNCPRPDEDDILSFDPCCQQYVLNRSRCEIPDYWENSDIARDSECVSYIIDYFSYIGCYENYSRDEDFLNDEWHIYMNGNFVSTGIDILYLRDQNGLFVDKYRYGSPCCD